MPTQEERLSALEKTVTVLRRGLRDIDYNETILLGVISEQGKDIREMKVSLAALNEHLGSFEQGVNTRFDSFEQGVNTRFDSFEQGVNTRFEAQGHRIESLEQSVNTRFEAQGHRIESLEQSVNTRFDIVDQRL